MNAEVAAPPLVQRLVDVHGACWIDQTNLQDFTKGDGARILFFCGDPIRVAEGLDVAVVLPARRFGVQRWPSLVFFRDGDYITTLAGMYDWNDYLERVQQSLVMPPSRKPGIGIPVVTLGGDSHCH